MAGRAKRAADLLTGPVSAQERFSADAQGALSNPKVERYALFLADDVPASRAWALAGYTDDTGYAKNWRRRVERDPVFQGRVRELTVEREELEASVSPFAQARWTASQLWRDARAQGDVKASEKAADLLFKIAEREVDWMRATGGATSAPAPAGRGPGRPPVELDQTREKPPSELASRLLARPRPEQDEAA